MEKNDSIYDIYLLIKEGNIDIARVKLYNISNNIISSNLKGFLSLKLRIAITDNNKEIILNLFDSYEMMSRDWIDLLIWADKNNFFDDIIEKYRLKVININFNENNITNLYKNIDKKNFIFFIENFKYKQLMLNIDINYDNDDLTQLQSNYYDSNIIESQMNIIKNNIKNATLKKVNYILDGGNILYSNKGKLNKYSYDKLYRIYNNREDVLVVLNIKHKKYIINDNKFNNVNIFYSPYNQNDDLYIIYYSLLFKANIISNDEFTDHIDKFSIKIPNLNFLKVFLDEKLIKYNDKNYKKIYNNKKATNVIQFINDNFYIPCKNNFLKIEWHKT